MSCAKISPNICTSTMQTLEAIHIHWPGYHLKTSSVPSTTKIFHSSLQSRALAYSDNRDGICYSNLILSHDEQADFAAFLSITAIPGPRVFSIPSLLQGIIPNPKLSWRVSAAETVTLQAGILQLSSPDSAKSSPRLLEKCN